MHAIQVSTSREIRIRAASIGAAAAYQEVKVAVPIEIRQRYPIHCASPDVYRPVGAALQPIEWAGKPANSIPS